MNLKKELGKLLLPTIKIAIGSSAAICIAEALHLEYASSAGIIALLTILTTKWETLWLSLYRLITFVLTVALSWVLFVTIRTDWITYGIFILLIVIICNLMNWKGTISVNAVIGAHFLTTGNFSPEFILNELLLIVIGISLAIILNLYHNTRSRKQRIIENMRYTEGQLQHILHEIAQYLSNKDSHPSVWEDIGTLEHQLQEFIGLAYEYQGNTFQSHPQYYIDYFEMRLSQFHILHGLHYELRKIREIPAQAHIISDYILYLVPFVIEINAPSQQIEKLEGLFQDMKQQPLPVTREEFESRAILYHILMDLEEFLIAKKRFVEELDDVKIETYWKGTL